MMIRYSTLNAMLTVICPPVGGLISIINVFKDRKEWRKYIFSICYALAALAYCYVPTTDSDLVRYFNDVKRYSGFSFGELFTRFITGKELLISYSSIAWVVGKLGMPHLLPAISTFFVYFIPLYIMFKVTEDINGDLKKCVEYMLFMIVTISFFSIANNVKNILAFCVAFYAIYRDVYLKKRNALTAFIYLFAFFLHASCMIIILIRFVTLLTGKLRVFALLFALFMKQFVSLLYINVGRISTDNVFSRLLSNFINKGWLYYYNTEASWAIVSSQSGSIKAAKIVYVLIVSIIVIYLVLYQRKKYYIDTFMNRELSVSLMRMSDCLFFMGVITFGCVPMVMPEYWRFAAIVILFGGIVFSTYYMIFRAEKIGNQLFYVAALLAVPAFLIWVRELFLYSDVASMIAKSFLANPIYIILNRG